MYKYIFGSLVRWQDNNQDGERLFVTLFLLLTNRENWEMADALLATFSDLFVKVK